MALELYSEPVGPTGGMPGDGAGKALGKPAMSSISLALREAVQNAWDARAEPNGSINFNIEVRPIGPVTSRILRDEVFPGADEVDVGIGKCLDGAPLMLVLTDTLTVGLEGPVRADEIVEKEPQRFVDFFRNVGSHQKTIGSGGTYGFGKGSLYELSKPSALAVFSRTKPAPDQPLQDRFMAAASRKKTRVGGKLLSGRHWWGRRRDRNDPVTDPVVGPQALDLAQRLGLSFDGSGTAIAIIGADLRLGPELKEEIVATLLYNFWPKMLPGKGDGRAIRFSLQIDDDAVPIPDPATHPKLRFFTQCYAALGHSNRLVTSLPIEVNLPEGTAKVGRLAYVRVPHSPAAAAVRKRWEPFGDRTNHICLLREPELVVKYLSGPSAAGQANGYAGVFRADAHFDRVFALSEPPAHDDWSYKTLAPKYRKIVSATLRSINSTMRTAIGAPVLPPISTDRELPLGALANFLGGLLEGIEGESNAVIPAGLLPVGRGNKRTSSIKPTVRIISNALVRVDVEAQTVLAQVELEVTAPAGMRQLTVSANAIVRTADGREGEPPTGEPTIRVLAWHDKAGRLLGRSAEISVKPSKQLASLLVDVALPRTAAGLLSFSADGSVE